MPNTGSGGVTVVATGRVVYMQDFTKAMCEERASSASVGLIDVRDGNDYKVRYINNNCWMISNLRFTETTLDSATSNVASTYTKANPYNINSGSGWKSLTDDSVCKTDAMTADNSTYACNYSGQIDSSAIGAGQPTVWYNYAAATAGTITGTSSTNNAVYDVCPKGWRLPDNTEISGIVSYSNIFNVVTGGLFVDGNIPNYGVGYWWASTADNTKVRYLAYTTANNLYTNTGYRNRGLYIRCIRAS